MATAKKTAAPEATETTAASTEVAPVNTESTAVATAAPVNMESMLLQSAGQGFEEVTQQDTSTPRIVVLQKGNPQVNKQEAAYVKGSEVGMFYNTATKQFYPASEEDDNGILVVPCFFTAVEMEFKPNRGGFAGIRLRADVKDDEIVESKGADGKKSRIFADTGNDAVLTKQHYCLLLEQDAEGNPTGSYAPVLVPLKGMGLRASTSWMTMAGQQMLNGRKLPMFSTIYRLKTVWGKNDQGDFYIADGRAVWAHDGPGHVPSCQDLL